MPAFGKSSVDGGCFYSVTVLSHNSTLANPLPRSALPPPPLIQILATLARPEQVHIHHTTLSRPGVSSGSLPTALFFHSVPDYTWPRLSRALLPSARVTPPCDKRGRPLRGRRSLVAAFNPQPRAQGTVFSVTLRLLPFLPSSAIPWL